MKILIILNEGPYSNEKSYNGLRTGIQFLTQVKDAEVNFYLFSDSVACVVKDQKPAAVKYNTGELAAELLAKGAKIKLCKSCMEARGVTNLIDGVEISNLKEYTEWVVNCDKIISF